MTDVGAVLELLLKAGELKCLKRTGWVERGVTDPESVSDHIFMTSLIALVLGSEEDVDLCKVLKMTLLHDLQEATCGDITPASPLIERKYEIEKEAIESILFKMPQEYLDLWQEYIQQDSKEAKLAHEADRLEMLLQALTYEKEGYDLTDFFELDYQLTGRFLDVEKEVRLRRKI